MAVTPATKDARLHPRGKRLTPTAAMAIVVCPRGTTVSHKGRMACGTHVDGMGHPQPATLLALHHQGLQHRRLRLLRRLPLLMLLRSLSHSSITHTLIW